MFWDKVYTILNRRCLICLTLLLSSWSLHASSEISNLKVNDNQIGLIRQLTQIIPDSLSLEEQFIALNTEINARKARKLSSLKILSEEDLQSLFYFLNFPKYILEDGKQKLVLKNAIDVKANEFMELNKHKVAEFMNGWSAEEMSIGREQIESFIAIVLFKTFVEEDWSIENLATYDFKDFERYIFKSISYNSDNLEEKIEEWLSFIAGNLNVNLFEMPF